MQTISPMRIRAIWKTVNNAPANEITSRNDTDLVNWLVQRLGLDLPLPASEVNMLRLYINSRLPLIRDLNLD